ncbi:MAG: hypothetical protein U0K87_12735, partial [Ruminococcus sp.]|nr:hypothetical protein [Ruminococcus sp.]
TVQSRRRRCSTAATRVYSLQRRHRSVCNDATVHSERPRCSVWGDIFSDISAESITYMKYKFGSNELYIGKGIIGILEYLEKRYGLNFSQLEENLTK